MDLQVWAAASRLRLARLTFLLALVLRLCAPASPQFAAPDNTLDVRVVTSNGAQLPLGTRVTISGERTTKSLPLDAYGTAQFVMVPPGFYRLAVTIGGSEVAQATVEVNAGRANATVLEVHLAGSRAASGATVSAADLAVPPKARKELRKANELLARKDWKGAREHALKAIAIHASFADAYNTLGVVAIRQDARDEARASFLKAVEIAPAHAEGNANLARIALFQQDWAEAERRAQVSIKSDSSSASTYLLLTVAQFKLGKLDDAIASAGRVHLLTPLQNPAGHLIAATCYRLENRRPEAIAEYQAYLQEAPTARNAGEVRKKLQALQHPELATAN